jgi:hypothetical protein
LHLTLALEAGYQTGEKPVTAALIEIVLSRLRKIRALFNNKLEPACTGELRGRMLAAGLSI